MSILKTENNKFILNGKPFRIISGAVHYFRIPQEYWHDRLSKLRACGCNTVETYMPWNLHEPQECEYVFGDMLDIERFLRIAQELGLYAIVRPGPYICSEWDFGGLPYWLLKYDIALRCYDKIYLEKVDRYFDEVCKRLKGHLAVNGGNIICMQVENEYGSYGNDKRYLEHLRDGLIKRGMDALLITSDGACDHMMTGGMTQDVLETVNFGSDAQGNFRYLQTRQENMPLMCTEFWNGWFDIWGEPHHTRDTQSFKNELETILSMNASVNFYMFHGGTNFGFMNGANTKEGKYEPQITSHDYDAPLGEYGNYNDKYFAAREVIQAYTETELPPVPEPPVVKDYGEIKLVEQVYLFDSLDNISEKFVDASPKSMEQYGQAFGYILYRTHVAGPRGNQKLDIPFVRDRAHVYINGTLRGIFERNDENTALEIFVDKSGIDIDILIENRGRTNYGMYLYDRKGLIKNISLSDTFVFGWEIYTLPLNNLEKLSFEPLDNDNKRELAASPVFMRGYFDAAELNDTFVCFKNLTKGIIIVNGFNLGRYWDIGPQGTLYLPAPFLKKGRNEVIVFETDGVKENTIYLQDSPVLDINKD